MSSLYDRIHTIVGYLHTIASLPPTAEMLDLMSEWTETLEAVLGVADAGQGRRRPAPM